jgi:hypothetical protein
MKGEAFKSMEYDSFGLTETTSVGEGLMSVEDEGGSNIGMFNLIEELKLCI